MAKKVSAWIPVWAIIIASILISTQYGKVPPSQPSMIDSLGISYTMQGLLMTAFSASALVMAMMFGGTLIDRIGARKVVSVALLASVLGNAIALFATNDAALLATRVLEGAGYGVTMTAGPVIIAAWYEPKKRGIASGVWGANVGLGMLLSTGIANPILAATDWTGMWAFSLASTVLALLLVIICVKMPDSTTDANTGSIDDGAAAVSAPTSSPSSQPSKHGFLWGYCAPFAILVAFMFFLVGGATDAFNSFTVTYLNIALDRPYAEANLTSMLASFGMLVGSVIIGVIFARAKDKMLVLIVNIALCAVFLFAWFNMDASMPVMYAVGFLGGCFLGAAPALFFAIPPFVARSPHTVGAAVALVVLGQNLGTLAIPAIVGGVLDASGYPAAAIVMGSLACAALIVAIACKRTMGAKLADPAPMNAAELDVQKGRSKLHIGKENEH